MKRGWHTGAVQSPEGTSWMALGAIGLAESLGRIVKRRHVQWPREREASKPEGVVQ